MLKSDIVEIDGTFVGTAILEGDRATRRFYAAHESVRPLHNRALPSLDALKRQVALQFRHAQPKASSVLVKQRS
ncbi:hypothetical protein PWM43_10625 [Acetobacteraceae bacterium LMG 32668]|uniref:Uncharacterized protein n=2 Tax=Brytella acorum TaxID=2959299 RepID=A0AA35UJL0_9PROT|nr:hypothetical protein [Brytella acorum]MDF3625390.1 hypothetical protein [Brytella acorum]CAI9121546.1 hypothetical protein LMG32879_002393 [Brytella acorum]